MMDSVLAALVREHPEIVRAKGPDREALRRALYSHLPLLTDFLITKDDPARLGAPADDWARRLAEADIELGALVQSYELGSAHLWASSPDRSAPGGARCRLVIARLSSRSPRRDCCDTCAR